MSVPTCAVSVIVQHADGALYAGARVRAELTNADTYQGVVAPSVVEAVTDAQGACTLALFPNALGQVGSRYRVTISRDSLRDLVLYAYVPDAPTAALHDLLVTDTVPPQPLIRLGTAAGFNAPDVGANASAAQLVRGDDTRLADARTPLPHVQGIGSIDGLQAQLDLRAITLPGPAEWDTLPSTPQVAIGARARVQQPGALQVVEHELESDGIWRTSPTSRRARAQAGGLRVLCLGGSYVGRTRVGFNFSPGGYQRTNGVAQVLLPNFQWFRLPGHRFMMANRDDTDLEGFFVVQSTSPQGDGTLVTFVDPRPNKNGSVGGGRLQDLHTFSLSAGWPAYVVSMLDGAVDIQTYGVSGADLTVWANPARLARLAQLGTFDVLIMDSLGNETNQPNPAATAVDRVDAFIEECMRRTGARLVLLPPPPPIRNIAQPGVPSPVAEELTRGRLVAEYVAYALQRKRSYIRVVHFGQQWQSRWQAFTAATQADIAAGVPPTEWMDPDGTHTAYPAAIRRAPAIARELQPLVVPFRRTARDGGDSRLVSTALDLDGGKASNLLRPWYGQVATAAIAGAGRSGPAPVDCAVSLNPTGTTAIVSSVVQHPLGHAQWRLQVNEPAASATGTQWGAQYAPAELLAALNAAENQNVDLQFSATVAMGGFAEYSLRGANIAAIYATSGGVEFELCACISDAGVDQHEVIGRAMDIGFARTFHSPLFRVPAGTVFTAARIQFIQVRHMPSAAATPPGAYTVEIDGDFALRTRTNYLGAA